MRIPLDENRSKALYLQVADHIARGIRNGNIKTGQSLPSRRVLAKDLGISRVTVESAYAELEGRGLVEAREGSGTYVLPLPGPHEEKPAVSHDTEHATSLWRGNNRQIDLAYGGGAFDMRPAEDFRRCLNQVLKDHSEASFAYAPAAGVPELREAIARYLADGGLEISAEDILVTVGSQHGLSLAFRSLVKSGELVAVESPSYSRMLELLQLSGGRAFDIPWDDDGPSLDQLDAALARGARVAYIISNYANPTGRSMDMPRRRNLVSRAEASGMVVIEDDYVGDLRYDGRSYPPLKALDRSGNVVYVSSFSKMLMPGLRLGFIVAAPELRERMRSLLSSELICVPTPLQAALARFLDQGLYRAHIRRTRGTYRRKRERALKACADYLPQTCRWDIPRGGLFLWLELFNDQDAEKLSKSAENQGLLLAPGTWYFSNPDQGKLRLRVNYVAESIERVEKGIAILGGILED